MDNDRLDLSPLDPTRDRERFEAIVRSISGAAAGELARRRARASVVGQVGLWWRPLVAAAAIAGVVSIGALLRYESATPVAETEIGIAEAIGVPEQVAEWIRSDELPTTLDLLVTLEDES